MIEDLKSGIDSFSEPVLVILKIVRKQYGKVDRFQFEEHAIKKIRCENLIGNPRHLSPVQIDKLSGMKSFYSSPKLSLREAETLCHLLEEFPATIQRIKKCQNAAEFKQFSRFQFTKVVSNRGEVLIVE